MSIGFVPGYPNRFRFYVSKKSLGTSDDTMFFPRPVTLKNTNVGHVLPSPPRIRCSGTSMVRQHSRWCGSKSRPSRCTCCYYYYYYLTFFISSTPPLLTPSRAAARPLNARVCRCAFCGYRRELIPGINTLAVCENPPTYYTTPRRRRRPGPPHTGGSHDTLYGNTEKFKKREQFALFWVVTKCKWP